MPIFLKVSLLVALLTTIGVMVIAQQCARTINGAAEHPAAAHAK